MDGNGSALIPGNESDDQRTFLDFIAEHSIIDAELTEVRERKKMLRARVKDAGFGLREFDIAREMAEEPSTTAKGFYHSLGRMLEWTGKAVGFQADLFGDKPEEDNAGVDLNPIQQEAIKFQGGAAGQRGAPVGDNPFSPGSQGYQIWDLAWHDGQRILAERLGPAPRARRGRGRPQGSKDSYQRPRKAAASDGVAVGDA